MLSVPRDGTIPLRAGKLRDLAPLSGRSSNHAGEAARRARRGTAPKETRRAARTWVSAYGPSCLSSSRSGSPRLDYDALQEGGQNIRRHIFGDAVVPKRFPDAEVGQGECELDTGLIVLFQGQRLAGLRLQARLDPTKTLIQFGNAALSSGSHARR